MRFIILFSLFLSFIASAAKQPEQWLTPERRAALKTIVTRPIITKAETTKDGIVYTWTNGLHGCTTTQKLARVLGKPSKDARREQVEAIKAERDTIKAERDTIKAERDEAKAERDTLKTENATLKKQKGTK